MQVPIQRLAGLVGKRRAQRLAVPSVTPRAKIHLAIARESSRIQYCSGCRDSGFRCLSLEMFSSRAMTLFATDANREARGVVFIRRRRQRLKIRRVTFKAP